LGENSQQFLASIKLSDGRNVLISAYVSGKQPDVNTNPVNKKSLESAVLALAKLDAAGVLHRDLKKENLVVDDEGKIKLIDFGEAVEFDFLDTKVNDGHNFPAFETPTNFQSFEDTFISPYYDELNKIDKNRAKAFFSNYLKHKAVEFYGIRSAQLQEYLEENRTKLSVEQIETLERMIDFQEVNYSVLSKEYNNSDIVEIELMRNQVMYLSELAYKNEVLLCNPLANVSLKANALISAKKLEAMVLAQINRPNKPEVRKYLDYQLQNARYRQERIAGWLNGLVGWFTTCLTTDINTSDENKKKLIDECVYGKNLEDFEIPSIAQGVN
jgi:tRNA A-37 threonylcarbamoyl transferase component Bud32